VKENEVPASPNYEHRPEEGDLANSRVEDPSPEEDAHPQQPEVKKKTSGLSLKSIQLKKDHEEKQRFAKQKDKVELTGEFTEEQVQGLWKDYTQKLRRKGKKLVASGMATELPRVEGNEIIINLPNDTMRKELQSIEKKLMGFIKEEINNTQIRLRIEVDETITKKYAFTPKEKFEKLKEKNPLIDKLRSTFDLDI
jgi:DNA polymerase-3 subunit gamma/tau